MALHRVPQAATTSNNNQCMFSNNRLQEEEEDAALPSVDAVPPSSVVAVLKSAWKLAFKLLAIDIYKTAGSGLLTNSLYNYHGHMHQLMYMCNFANF